MAFSFNTWNQLNLTTFLIKLNKIIGNGANCTVFILAKLYTDRLYMGTVVRMHYRDEINLVLAVTLCYQHALGPAVR